VAEAAGSTRDALATMRSQVDAAHAAAEQLVREAEERARAQAASTPERGWAGAPATAPEGPGTTVEALQAILGLLEVLRGAVPPELAEQLAGAMRELLKAVRALIDYSLERLDAPPEPGKAPREVRDIPID